MNPNNKYEIEDIQAHINKLREAVLKSEPEAVIVKESIRVSGLPKWDLVATVECMIDGKEYETSRYITK